MKKTKVIGLIPVLCIAVLAFVGTAAAQSEYKVIKGDTLWGVSHKIYGTGNKWKEIAKNNNITEPKKLKIGQKLNIPPVGKIRITNHMTAPYGASGAKADPKVIAAIEKIDARFDDIKDELKKYVTANDPQAFILKKGQEAQCVSDKKGVHCYPEGYIYDWKKLKELPAAMWAIELENLICQIRVIRYCGNFDLWCEKIKAEEPQKIEEPQQPEAEVPTREIIPAELPPIEEKPKLTLPPEEKPVVTLPEEKVDFYRVKYPPQCRFCVEHEPIAGIYAYKNKAVHGYGIYAEYMAWLRKRCNGGYLNGWSPGAGVYGYYSRGWSDFTTFQWWEKGIGPEIGAKYLDFHSDGEPYQFQLKGRLVQEWTKGWNSEGYWDRQKHLKPGLYAEFSKRADEKTLWGVTGEAWWSAKDSIKSSWAGAEPSDRTTFMVAGYVQKKTGEDTQVRVSLMPAWTGWDRQFWVNTAIEMRYKETLMIGPSIGIPVGVSSLNRDFGLDWQNMLTGRVFARIELGKPLRDLDAKTKSSRIKLIDRPDFDEVDKKNESANIDSPVLLNIVQ